MKLLSKAIKILLIISFLKSCAAIPANKVKLESYPDIKNEKLGNLNLQYDFIKNKSDEEPFNIMGSFNKIDEVKSNFKRDFSDKIDKKMSQKNIKKFQTKIDGLCLVKIYSKNTEEFDGACGPYYMLTFFTLFAIPYYCQRTFEAKATLISYPKDSEVTGNIVPSISSAKIGDLFLDENNRPAKLLKTYDLKDKVHEVWSLIWTLTWFFVDTKRYSSATSPEGAAYQTEETISEALVRSILNDANKFEECRVR
jgi:hypothetical protein